MGTEQSKSFAMSETVLLMSELHINKKKKVEPKKERNAASIAKMTVNCWLRRVGMSHKQKIEGALKQ